MFFNEEITVSNILGSAFAIAGITIFKIVGFDYIC